MSMRKKVKLIIILALIPVFCLSGCSSGNRVYKLELIVRYAQSAFWQYVYIGAQAAATQHEVEITYLGPGTDRLEQKEILEQSIQRKPDAIILAAADYNLMVEPMEKVVDAGIDVIMVDSGINSDKWVSFVSSDNYDIGANLASELISATKKPGSVGIIDYMEGTLPFVERQEGFLSVMSGSDDLTVADIVYCDRSVDVAEQLAEDMIMANPDLVAIAGLSGICSIGAAKAIERLGRSDITLVSIDLSIDAVHYMERGIINVAIIQNPYLMGYYSVETAVRHLSGKRVERNIFTETRVITKENIFTEENQQLIFPFD